MAIEGKTGNFLWMTSSNVSWSPCCEYQDFPLWHAGSINAYVVRSDNLIEFYVDAYSLAGKGTKMYTLLPFGCLLHGLSSIIEESGVLYIFLPCQVLAYDAISGEGLWQYDLPSAINTSNTYAVHQSNTVAPTCLSSSSSSPCLLVSYESFVYSGNPVLGTIALDLRSGLEIWSNPAFSGMSMYYSNLNPSAGGTSFYYSAYFTKYSSGVVSISTLTGGFQDFFALDYDHNFVGTNIVAYPDNTALYQFGDNSDGGLVEKHKIFLTKT